MRFWYVVIMRSTPGSSVVLFRCLWKSTFTHHSFPCSRCGCQSSILRRFVFSERTPSTAPTPADPFIVSRHNKETFWVFEKSAPPLQKEFRNCGATFCRGGGKNRPTSWERDLVSLFCPKKEFILSCKTGFSQNDFLHWGRKIFVFVDPKKSLYYVYPRSFILPMEVDSSSVVRRVRWGRV